MFSKMLHNRILRGY